MQALQREPQDGALGVGYTVGRSGNMLFTGQVIPLKAY